jgi:xanthine dehydrogenase YagS FAD-binding subunit
MQPFAYRRAETPHAASAMAAERPGAAFIAGGTDLLQLWKSGACAPKLVIDIARLPLDRITCDARGLRIGALARLSDVAAHPAILSDYPVIAEALLASASPQIRNAATVGGNLLQRSRCGYFRGEIMPCNKRQPGTGCAALNGENRAHAVFGASPHCVATHASDLAVALVALDADLHLHGPEGERRLRLEDVYLLPGDTPERETSLRQGELIVAVEVAASACACRSRYLKLRDRASFEFAVLSVAVGLEVEDGRIRAARIAAGGVGTKPWRLRACEAALLGEHPDETAFRKATSLAAEGAQPLSRNGFKLELLQRSLLRTLTEVAQ